MNLSEFLTGTPTRKATNEAKAFFYSVVLAVEARKDHNLRAAAKRLPFEKDLSGFYISESASGGADPAEDSL